MLSWFDFSHHSIWWLVPIVLVSLALLRVSVWLECRDFDKNRRQLVLQVLQRGNLTEQDIVELDHDISPHGLITKHLERMAKEGLINKIDREYGRPKYELTDQGRHALRAAAPSPNNSTEAA